MVRGRGGRRGGDMRVRVGVLGCVCVWMCASFAMNSINGCVCAHTKRHKDTFMHSFIEFVACNSNRWMIMDQCLLLADP